eukprot:3171924-Pyramimonas_sp.AAC.1
MAAACRTMARAQWIGRSTAEQRATSECVSSARGGSAKPPGVPAERSMRPVRAIHVTGWPR